MKMKTAKIIFSVTLSLLILEVLFICWRVCKSDESLVYKQSYPGGCPNTLWTCTEGDMYFAVDENGETMGAVMAEGKTRYFYIRFYSRTQGLSVLTLNDIARPDRESCQHCFYGELDCTEDGCTLSYDGADDKERYFGERQGRVALSFIKSELPGKFSFGDEGSLGLLPFR